MIASERNLTRLHFMQEVDGEPGYSLKLKLSENDLSIFRQIIRIQWLYRLQILVPEKISEFDQQGMEQYHQLSHLVDHANTWPKHTRIFPREAVPVIRNMDFFKKLELELGKVHITDEENLGWENIYWRLVRPGIDDYGSIHADKWFWDLGINGFMPPTPHRRLKIWIAIHTVAGKNGLGILPGSHRKQDWKWHSEERYGRPKPIFDEPLQNSDLVLLPLNPGETVVFHDELLHGGMANVAETTRVSAEFTLLVPDIT